MKKFLICFFVAFCFVAHLSYAQFMVTEEKSQSQINVNYSSFSDYAPIAYFHKPKKKYGHLETIFSEALQEISTQAYWDLHDENFDSIESAQKAFENGKIDLFLGNYYDDAALRYADYIYPAVLNNPIHVIILPRNQEKIKTTEDLKNLKGVYVATEHFSGYMLNNFKRYNISPAANALEAYEKLFIGQIDYIIGSYYYNYVQASLLGLKNEVVFSKAALWNMPLFLVVSKASQYNERIKRVLSRYVMKPAFKDMVEKSLRDKVREFEIVGQSVVPPSFVRKQTAEDITPADRKD